VAVQAEVPGAAITTGLHDKEVIDPVADGLTVNAIVLGAPPYDAVICATTVEDTEVAVATNVVEVEPAGIDTDPGTVISPAEEDSGMLTPPAGATVDSVAAHVEVPGEVITVGLHVTDSVGAAVPPVTGMVLPAVDVGMLAPSSVALTASLTEIGTLPDAAGVNFTATFATTPLAIVDVLTPVSRQIADPEVDLH
jgi:hypothetical protein